MNILFFKNYLTYIQIRGILYLYIGFNERVNMNCERCAESIMINGNYVPSNGACIHCVEEKESHKESFNENEETKSNQD